MLIGMAQGQEGEEHLFVADAEIIDQHLGGARRIVQDRAMMLHHSARRAAGAAGVDKAGGIIARHREPARLRVRQMRLAAFDQRRPVVDRHLALLADAQTFHTDDDMRVGPHHRGHQGARELCGRDDDGARAAVVEDMLVIAFGVRGVGGHGDAPRRHDGEIGDAEFGPVFADEDDAVALLQPQRAQIMRERGDLVRNLPPAQRLPRAVGLVPEKGAFAAPFGTVEKHRDQTGKMVEMRVVQLHASRSPREVIVVGSFLGSIATR